MLPATAGSGMGSGSGGSSGSAGDAGSGGSSAGQAGGTSDDGGTGGAAAGAGGSSDANGGSTGGVDEPPTMGAHCTPGTAYEAFRAYTQAGGPISNCSQYDPAQLGLSAEADISVRSIALSAPLTAEQAMAFSIEWVAGGATIEFWGSSSACGAGVERLTSSESLAPNITCATWSTSAEFEHVLMVYTAGGGNHGDVTLCPSGSCAPAER